jgi:hypothetical protein
MNSFELEIDEKSRAGSEFMASVVNEIRRAVASEKASRKLTQQAIADKIGTSRAVINRQIQGLENLSARRIGEILWAIGWKPNFEAQKIPAGENLNPSVEIAARAVKVEVSPPSTTSRTVILPPPTYRAAA